MKKYNGGPAFPKQGLDGMTLRDYFAAQAMQGILSLPGQNHTLQNLAERAGRIADAMLSERDQEEKSQDPRNEECKVSDKNLLVECLRVLEYATFHDGRYGQVESDKFQKEAYPIVKKLSERFGLDPYEQFKE